MLVFRYGTMSGSKTSNLIMSAYDYSSKNKKILILKHGFDTRNKKDTIKSKSGLSAKVDYLIINDEKFNNSFYSDIKDCFCIFCDEIQFSSKSKIDELKYISHEYNIPIYCYGLKTDFNGHLFEGSKRLFEIADKLEEIENNCGAIKCKNKAMFNMRLQNNKKVNSDNIIDIGDNDKYLQVCFTHYMNWEK
jgi:thymidine kinase